MLISPRIITYFVRDQLNLVKSNKINNNFNNNLQKKLLKLIQQILLIYKNNISGLKILITGK